MFALTERTVTLANFNPRVENNGPNDKKPAADLKIAFNVPNVELAALFHPDLKASLYTFDEQRGGDLVDAAHKDEDPSFAPHLRFPKLGPLKWELDIECAQVRIAYGVKSEIALPDCKVNTFTLEPQDGGTVAATFRIQGHPDGKAAGRLYDLQGCEITLTVEPPTVEPGDDLAGEGDDGAGGDGKDGPQTPAQKAKSFFKEKVE